LNIESNNSKILLISSQIQDSVNVSQIKKKKKKRSYKVEENQDEVLKD
jgi:hypothetical protein